MIICSCNVLSDQDVRNAMTTGVPPRTISELFRFFGRRAQCGFCARSVKRVMDSRCDDKDGRDCASTSPVA
jgi:bacterioferritin-associated ferredoxin